MKLMKKMLVGLSVVSMLFALTACQNTEQKTEQVKEEDKVVAAATAYVKGFVQGDTGKYDAYYGNGAFENEINAQLEKFKQVPAGAEVNGDLWKDTVKKSRKMYAKAEIVSITKKDETTATVKVKPLSVKIEDRENWAQKKSDELDAAIQKGDEKAIEQKNGLLGTVFEAIASGEIPSTLEAEESFDLVLVEKDGKLKLADDDFNKVVSFIFKNKQ